MDSNLKNLIVKFNDIKKMGYIDSHYIGYAGVGRTFEYLLGIDGNCLEFPDLDGIEIKTKCSEQYGELSLFNCSPIGNTEYEIERIKNKYGYPDKEYKNYRVLNASINCLEKEKVGIFYKFKLRIDKMHRKIILLVFNLRDELIDDTTFWPLDLIECRFLGKCSTLAFINARKRYDDGHQAFFYHTLKIMKSKSFDVFIDLIEKGIITIDFKIGIFKTKENFGKIHDHGTAFRIAEKNLGLLFDVVYDSNNLDILVKGDQGA